MGPGKAVSITGQMLKVTLSAFDLLINVKLGVQSPHLVKSLMMALIHRGGRATEQRNELDS